MPPCPAWFPAHDRLVRYGLEKLYAEEMCLAYAKDFPIATRVARYHNVYGPEGTWKGGREKAPAAFCRKAICSTDFFEMWGERRWVASGRVFGLPQVWKLTSPHSTLTHRQFSRCLLQVTASRRGRSCSWTTAWKARCAS